MTMDTDFGLVSVAGLDWLPAAATSFNAWRCDWCRRSTWSGPERRCKASAGLTPSQRNAFADFDVVTAFGPSFESFASASVRILTSLQPRPACRAWFVAAQTVQYNCWP